MLSIRPLLVLPVFFVTLCLAAERPVLENVPRIPVLQRSSGYSFAGTVTSVARTAPQEQGVATVRITFRVDRGIQGVRTGQTLTIQEWSALWDAGQRYRPGERVLLFLYPPSRLGLTSVVGTTMGRFPIARDGRITIPAERRRLLPAEAQEKIGDRTEVDLHELIKVLRPGIEGQP